MAKDEAPKTGEDTQGAPQPTPEPVVASMTSEDFAAELEDLFARARAAGISSAQVTARAYVRQGLAAVDGFLRALDQSPPKKPPTIEAPKKGA